MTDATSDIGEGKFASRSCVEAQGTDSLARGGSALSELERELLAALKAMEAAFGVWRAQTVKQQDALIDARDAIAKAESRS